MLFTVGMEDYGAAIRVPQATAHRNQVSRLSCCAAARACCTRAAQPSQWGLPCSLSSSMWSCCMTVMQPDLQCLHLDPGPACILSIAQLGRMLMPAPPP